MKMRIDGREIEVRSGETIMEAARRAGISIPALCYHEAFGGQGHCRMCMVEVQAGGVTRLVASCTYPVTREVEVKTSTPAIEKIRRDIVTLLYKRAPDSDFMERLYHSYGCSDNTLHANLGERCIMCRLCVRACEEMGVSAISAVSRGTDKRIATPYDEASPDCIGCGACADICPTGAIEVIEKGSRRVIWNKVFEMADCQRCGRPFATLAQLEYLESRLDRDVVKQRLCSNCRRKEVVGKVRRYNASLPFV